MTKKMTKLGNGYLHLTIDSHQVAMRRIACTFNPFVFKECILVLSQCIQARLMFQEKKVFFISTLLSNFYEVKFFVFVMLTFPPLLQMSGGFLQFPIF